ncbi:MAG: hypothetical protein EHM48_06635 [Planctomycetaceae bacterium]|nr:MAG: hypothetical protein EHM48_06635 [Planctomycetaceae bacterium]
MYCFSFVEDAPSAAVAKKLVEDRNSACSRKLILKDGFPKIMGGYGPIKTQAPAFLNMAKAGIYTFTITDLDTRPCASSLIREWFSLTHNQPVTLPIEVLFRVAVREIESWLLADRAALAGFLGIHEQHFSAAPDDLPDPKQHLFSVLSQKGKKAFHREMLPNPRGTANIGPRYNEIMCEFIEKKWSPSRAATASPSLARAIAALRRI